MNSNACAKASLNVCRSACSNVSVCACEGSCLSVLMCVCVCVNVCVRRLVNNFALLQTLTTFLQSHSFSRFVVFHFFGSIFGNYVLRRARLKDSRFCHFKNANVSFGTILPPNSTRKKERMEEKERNNNLCNNVAVAQLIECLAGVL